MKKPINDMLTSYSASHPIRLHMPGHKGRTTSLSAIDITELPFSDTLHNPSGVIEQSQQQYAKQVGAKYCHYLVNGSTSGVLAMMCCSRGKVLVDSCSHSSIYNSATLLNRQLVVVDNSYSNDMPLPLSYDDIAKALGSDKEIGTVMLTSPNYYGMTSDIKQIYKLCKSRDIILFVDSAHGAHFGLSKLLPVNAIKHCDACVESTHKTLGAYTQTAVLLVDNKKLSLALKQAINATMTTSPSYLLMDSIESSISYASDNTELYQQLHEEVVRFTKRASLIGYLVVKTDDFTRLVIDCGDKNARLVYDALCKQGVYCEFADERYLVAILTLFDNGLTLDCLLTALTKLDLSSASKYDNSYVVSRINKE